MVYKAIHCDCQKRCIWAEGEGGGGEGGQQRRKAFMYLKTLFLRAREVKMIVEKCENWRLHLNNLPLMPD